MVTSHIMSNKKAAPSEANESSTARLGLLVLLAASGLWIGAVLAAPFLAEADSSLSKLLYQLFGSICHQQPERSFHLAGHPLAVCHRCFGLYLGFAVGLLAMPRLPRLATFIEDHPKLLLATTAPLLLDVVLLGLNTPISRFSTGLLAGFPIALFCWRAAEQIIANRGRFSSEAA